MGNCIRVNSSNDGMPKENSKCADLKKVVE
jgi:hypothetical protein